MKKLYLFTIICLILCGRYYTAQAQVAYPYFPKDSTLKNLSTAVVVSNPPAFMVNLSGNFTLEAQGTGGAVIRIADTALACTYTPAATATVRFVKSSGVLYVYENTVFKGTLSLDSSAAGSGITSVSGSALYVAHQGLAPVITPNYAAGDYVDMTSLITNPSFENLFTGWQNNGMYTQNNNSLGALKDGNTYVERWVGGPPLPDVSITQTVSNIPLGKYTLRVAGQNISQATPGNQTGGYGLVSGGQFAITQPNEYAFNFLVVDGSANIGYKTVNSSGNWTAVDNFRLYYLGTATDSMQTSLQVLTDSGTVVLNKKMQAPLSNSLATAVNKAKNVLNNSSSSLTDLAAAIAGLRTALNDASFSANAYINLQAAIDSARGVYGNGSGNAADTLLTVIHKNDTLVNNLNASLQSLQNGIPELYAAIFSYKLANGTGAAPVVVTNPRFARGATMIFGRSTVTGVNTIEEGFCWNTTSNPTIYDNRTTKNFWNNGAIYRIENLTPGTIYYVRAYAISSGYAVGYGKVLKVITIPMGKETYTLNGTPGSWGDNYDRINHALTGGTYYHNNLTSIKNHHYSVYMNAGTPTAEGSYGGYIQFGANPGYQQIGTAMHEMAHTIGVGQHFMWYGPNSPLRLYGSTGPWLGERANNVLKFLDNDPSAQVQGDAMHFWPYGVNGAFEDNGSEFLYCANALIVEGLGEDGLPPTGGFATPAYSFEQEDTAKYYIKTAETLTGRDVTFLAENKAGQLYSKIIPAKGALANDSSAWYITFIPSTGYYRIKNAATGKYFSYVNNGNGFTLVKTTAPNENNAFQLMAARYTTTFTNNGRAFTFKPYSIVWPESRIDPPALTANTDASAAATGFSFENSATTQHWLILSKQQLDSLALIEVDNIPAIKSPRASSGDARSALTWEPRFGIKYTILKSTSEAGNYDTVATGLSGTRYVATGLINGSAYYFKILAYDAVKDTTVSSPVLTSLPKLGQHLYIGFNDTAINVGEDTWGGYHAALANGAAKDSSAAGKYLRLDGSPGSYATVANGAVSELHNFTVSTWLKLNSLDDWARLFDFGNNADSYMFFTPQSYSNNDSSNGIYAIKNGGDEQSLPFKYSWSLNTWTHIAIVQSEDSTRLYVNGVLVAGGAGISLRPSDLGITSRNYLGKSQFADPNLNGSIDEFRIYNYALDSMAIQALYGNRTINAPLAVSGLRPASGDGRVTLVWDAKPDVKYAVFRSLSAAALYDSIAGNLTSARFVDGNRINNTEYFYKVKAYNSAGVSPETLPVSGKPEKGRHVYISFDDTTVTKAIDAWNAYDAFLAPGTTRTQGKYGRGLKLNGLSGSYASLGTGVVSELGSFTVATWVKAASLNDWVRVFDFGAGTDKYMFMTVRVGAAPVLRYAISAGGSWSGEQTIDYNYSIPLNTWVHLAVTQTVSSTGSIVKLYVNGTAVAASTAITRKPSDLGITTQNWLGKSQFNDPMFDASYDDFRIYNYGLNDDEVAALAKATVLAFNETNFEGKATPAGNLLRWKIGPTAGMSIQLERSADGRIFTGIYETSAAASDAGQLFSYVDAPPKKSTTYYRLKMTGKNGAVNYSAVVALAYRYNAADVVAIYPSIVSSGATLRITALKAAKVNVRIMDTQGRILKTINSSVVTGNNLLHVDASSLSAGVYIVSVYESGGSLMGSSIRFIIGR